MSDPEEEGPRLAQRRVDGGWKKSDVKRAAGIRSRGTVDAVEAGTASRESVAKYRRGLEDLEAEAGKESPGAPPFVETSTELGVITFEISGDFGVRVVVKGPVGDADAVERSAARLIREIREGGSPEGDD